MKENGKKDLILDTMQKLISEKSSQAISVSDIAREAVLSVRMEVREDYRSVADGHYIPYDHVDSFHTAMQGLPLVILGEIIFLPVKDEPASGNPVGIRSHHCPEKAFARIVRITPDIVVPELDILIVSIPVRDPQAHDPGTEIRHLHDQIPVFQGIQGHGFPIHFSLEIRSRDQLHLRLFSRAARKHGCSSNDEQ